MEVVLNGTRIVVDETLDYGEFMVSGSKPIKQSINLAALLSQISKGLLPYHKEYFQLLSRWVHEAPRKRHFRNLRKQGFQIMSTEFFFENDEDGEKFITSLENSGKLACKVLEAYGDAPAPPSERTDPSTPQSVEGFFDDLEKNN